jgi:hypothetical protein
MALDVTHIAGCHEANDVGVGTTRPSSTPQRADWTGRSIKRSAGPFLCFDRDTNTRPRIYPRLLASGTAEEIARLASQAEKGGISRLLVPIEEEGHC